MLLTLMGLHKIMYITSRGPIAKYVRALNRSECYFLVIKIEQTSVEEERDGRPHTISFFCKMIR